MIGAIIFGAVVIIAVAFLYISNIKQAYISEAFQNAIRELDDEIKTQESVLGTALFPIKKDPLILRYVKTNNKEGLKKHIKNMELDKDNFLRGIMFHFHSKTLKSIYRSWTTKSGDELDTRYDLALTKRYQKNTSGIELGQEGIFVRSVEPLFEDKKYIGSVEAIANFDKISKNLLSTKGMALSAVYYKKEDVLNAHPKYYFAPNINKNIQNFIKQRIDFTKLSDEPLSFPGFFFASKPIHGSDAKKIGYFILAKDASLPHQNIATMQKHVFISILFILVLSGISIALLFYYLSRTIAYPLTKLTKEIEKIAKEVEQNKQLSTIDFYNTRKDEIGMIVFVINLLFKKTSQLIQETHKYAKRADEYMKTVNESNIVSKLDTDGIFTYANEEFLKLTGFELDEIIGMHNTNFYHPLTPKETLRQIWRTIEAKDIYKGVIRSLTKNGKNIYLQATIVPIINEENKIAEYLMIHNDITEVMNKEEEIRSSYLVDYLTKLGNRFKLIRNLKDSDNPILAIFDIKHFRTINDYYGFEMGDRIMRKISEQIFECFSLPQYEAYRLQGDSFGVLASEYDITYEDFVEKIKTFLNTFLSKSLTIDNISIDLDMTAGIAVGKKDLFNRTELAHKKAKKQNKRLIEYSPSIKLGDDYKRNVFWTARIKQAKEEDRIEPFFQPIINNKTKYSNNFECLMRLIDKDEEPISASLFLDEAKKSRLYEDLTKIMLKKSFELFSTRTDDAFSINICVEDIMSKDIIAYIINLEKQYNLLQKVIFEIVESDSIENFDAMSNFIKEVRRFGAKIAIDNFGTGYSNFDYLIKIRPDFIKIDGSMIKNINIDKNSYNIVNAIVQFAKQNNIETVAEFVHSEEIYEIVRDLGIDYSQGYFFGVPNRLMAS